MELIGPSLDTLLILSGTQEDRSLLKSTNERFHLRGVLITWTEGGSECGGSRPFPSVRVSSGSWNGC